MTGSPGWHHRDAVELAGEHGVDPTRGLDASDVAHRIARHGANELTGKEASSWLALLADQFKDFMVLVLIAAAVVSGAIGEPVDTLAIVVIVVLNAVIGFVQAWRADKAMAALQQLAAAHATVLRDGEVRQIPAAGLVPGDIVLLEAGNQVPADLRLIDLAQFRVDESALTGESVTVEKHTAPMTGVVHALGDRLNMAFKGTTATHGRARGLVVAIGHEHRTGQGGDACWTATLTAARRCNVGWRPSAKGCRWL
jgi:Ca2+-transporting ATPase